MKCSRCQHENPAGTKFCGQCAAPLASRCAACGAPNPPDNRFCGQCAAPLRPATTPSISAPEAYTPRRLAEKILTSKGALEGERKQVTVLFADLKGSMELLADRDPEEARKLLDPVLERMMEAVHRFEGTVNQVMGDGIMALFGAPLAHEDHAVRACCAALRMHASVAAVRGGGVPHARRAPPDPRGPQLRRGGRPRYRDGPAHGLHGGRPDHAPGRPHGADGGTGHDSARSRDCPARRGLRAGRGPGARGGQRHAGPLGGPGPASSGCAHSLPTVTLVSASSTGARATGDGGRALVCGLAERGGLACLSELRPASRGPRVRLLLEIRPPHELAGESQGCEKPSA